VVVVGLVMASPIPATAAVPSEPKPFVAHVIDRVVAELGGDVDASTRRDRFQGMMDRYLALDAITRFVTGRYWAEASDTDRSAFTTAFRDLLRVRFLPTLAKAGTVEVEMVGQRTLRDGLWSVTMRVRPGQSADATRVQLRVMRRDGDLRIADVVTRGVSLGVTLREEYTSYLERHDGDLGALTRKVRQRVADLRE
jgi:phospholipid transport system substrate-binding protein